MESPRRFAPLVSISVNRNSVASSLKLPATSDRNGMRLTPVCSPLQQSHRGRVEFKFLVADHRAEACAVREGVGLFDITTLKRIEVSGKGALEFLERLTKVTCVRSPAPSPIA